MSDKRFYKVLTSNYRSAKKTDPNYKMTNRSFPIWCESEQDYRFQLADYILYHVFNDRVEFIGGVNVAPNQLY